MPQETKKYEIHDREAFHSDFKQRIDVGQGYIFIMTTEEIDFRKVSAGGYKEDAEIDQLFDQGLEIRIFDEDSEWKWFRTGIGKAYHFRMLRDDEETKNDWLHWWNESQYLDIDMKRTKKEREKGKISIDEVYATGGGKYPLPVQADDDTKIRIRNYLGEDADTGELYVKDWRLAGFGEWPEEE